MFSSLICLELVDFFTKLFINFAFGLHCSQKMFKYLLIIRQAEWQGWAYLELKKAWTVY